VRRVDYDADNKPVLPTWAVGVLSGVRDVDTYNRDMQCETRREVCDQRR
jgi:hypothetical protein